MKVIENYNNVNIFIYGAATSNCIEDAFTMNNMASNATG